MSILKDEVPVDPAKFAAVQQSADTMLDQLLCWSDALKTAREKPALDKAA